MHIEKSANGPTRLGLFHVPNGSWWQASHCMAPFAQKISESHYRIHFAGRDAKNRSRGAWVDVEAAGSKLTILRAAQQPSLEIGRLGAFDDAGAIPCSLVSDGESLLLYYAGWTLGGTVPFHFHTGLAKSNDGGETFRRVSEAPVLGRNRHDPFLSGAPCVLKENGSYRMWYVSGTEWVKESDGAPVHYYTIKHARSPNGLDWETNDQLCIPYAENEYAIGRPAVTRVRNGYRMLYSARRLGETYRIYVAYSEDGLSWTRDPKPLIDTAPSGWDSEMVCYGSLLETSEATFLLYNGNGYGRDGFGLALL